MGRDYFVSYPNDLFKKTPPDFKWNEYCNQANEPVHHTAYLFTYAGKPWLAQRWARLVMNHAYGPGLAGLCGNEDVGLVCFERGGHSSIHPVSPVDGIYIIGSPLFDEVTFQLDPHFESGETFAILARNNSAENRYVQSATLDGKPFNRAWLRHSEVAGGGVLELVMGPKPNESWGSAPDELPPQNFPAHQAGSRLEASRR